MEDLKFIGRLMCSDCGINCALMEYKDIDGEQVILCDECSERRDNIPEPIIVSENRTSLDNENGVCYLYVRTNEFMSENEFNEWVDDNYNNEIHSDYDCTGRWFTSSIYIYKLPDAEIDYHLYSVIIKMARDV